MIATFMHQRHWARCEDSFGCVDVSVMMFLKHEQLIDELSKEDCFLSQASTVQSNKVLNSTEGERRGIFSLHLS